MKIYKRERWINDDGFEFVFEPIEESISIKKTKNGYEARYLTIDHCPMSPDGWEDENLFLVHYHRDFYISRDNAITEDDLRAWYNNEKIEQEKEYFIFPVSAYIHSGVTLKLGDGNFIFDSGGWDTSHVGAVLVSKKEFESKENAMKIAGGLIEEWNQYLEGDVYCLVKESYDKDKTPYEHDSVCNYYGYEYALKALKTEI